MKLNARRTNAGMTLFEVVLVLVVLAVLAVITVPKFKFMVNQSHEGHTKTGLAELRGAIAIYYSDTKGLYPSDEGTPETRLSRVLVPKYLKAIPPVELPHLHEKSLNTVHDHTDDQGDWMYSSLNGYVAVNCTHSDTKGMPVSNW